MNYDLHANYPRLVENETADKLEQPKATQDFVWTDEYDDQPVNLTTLMRSMMNANNWEMANVFVNSWFRMACHGNPTAIHELLDRIEGPISKTSGYSLQPLLSLSRARHDHPSAKFCRSAMKQSKKL